MTGAFVAAGAIVSAAATAYSANRASSAAKKAQKAESQRQSDYLAYQEKLRTEPKRLQPWNPVEYKTMLEKIKQQGLKNQMNASGIEAGTLHFGGGSTAKSPTGVMRYNRPTGSFADQLKASGFYDKLKARADYKPPADMLDIPENYIKKGVAPGTSPDWLLGVTKTDPAVTAAEKAAAAEKARAVKERIAAQRGGVPGMGGRLGQGGAMNQQFDEYDAQMNQMRR